MAETRKVFPPSLALLNLGNKKLYLQNLVLRECTDRTLTLLFYLLADSSVDPSPYNVAISKYDRHDI